MPPDTATDEGSPARRGLDRVAVLERTVAASLERVWENVLDWEHLPWLHRDAFGSIALEAEGRWGWRARVTSADRPEDPFVIEVRVERDAGRYVSRTLSGTGAGTEIWTTLEPRGAGATHVRVGFWLPGVPEAKRARVGEGYRRLYTRLWDEDEAMMRERTAQLAGRGGERRRPEAGNAAEPAAGRDAVREPEPEGGLEGERETERETERRGERARASGAARVLDLGPRAALLPRLPLCVELAGVRWRVVALGDEIHAHDARCPHRLGPLGDATAEAGADGAGGPGGVAGTVVPAGEVRCPWHGYRFDVRTGRSTDGRGLRLRRPPRVEADASGGAVRLVLD